MVQIRVTRGSPRRLGLGNLKVLIYQDDHRGASPHTPPGLRPGPARGMIPLDPQKFGYFILHELPYADGGDVTPPYLLS